MESTSKLDIIKKVTKFLQCFICKNKVYETNICPHCSQLFCYSCINSWFLTKESRCPQCKTRLDILQLVDCLWADDIMNYLGKLRPEVCSTHSEDMSIYCITCLGGVCYQCVLWDGTHSDHTIRPLTKLYESKLKLLKDEVASLEKLRDVTDFLAEETGQIEYINNVMKNSAIPELVSKSSELEVMISELKKTVLSRIPVPRPEPANSLPIIPSHYGDSHTYVVHPFSRLQQKGDPVYSNLFCSNGLCWRMIVYPNGVEEVRGNYLSVFLELCAGYRETSDYRYRIIMRNQARRDPSENVVRRYVSQFEVGQSNGDRRFFRLDLLARGGYLDQILDTLELAFQIKAPNFYQVRHNEQWCISHLDCNQAGSSEITASVAAEDQ